VLVLPLRYGDTVRAAGGSLAAAMVLHALALVLGVGSLAYGVVLMRRDVTGL
jgi:hypothetical protein